MREASVGACGGGMVKWRRVRMVLLPHSSPACAHRVCACGGGTVKWKSSGRVMCVRVQNTVRSNGMKMRVVKWLMWACEVREANSAQPRQYHYHKGLV